MSLTPSAQMRVVFGLLAFLGSLFWVFPPIEKFYPDLVGIDRAGEIDRVYEKALNLLSITSTDTAVRGDSVMEAPPSELKWPTLVRWTLQVLGVVELAILSLFVAAFTFTFRRDYQRGAAFLQIGAVAGAALLGCFFAGSTLVGNRPSVTGQVTYTTFHLALAGISYFIARAGRVVTLRKLDSRPDRPEALKRAA